MSTPPLPENGAPRHNRSHNSVHDIAVAERSLNAFYTVAQALPFDPPRVTAEHALSLFTRFMDVCAHCSDAERVNTLFSKAMFITGLQLFLEQVALVTPHTPVVLLAQLGSTFEYIAVAMRRSSNTRLRSLWSYYSAAVERLVTWHADAVLCLYTRDLRTIGTAHTAEDMLHLLLAAGDCDRGVATLRGALSWALPRGDGQSTLQDARVVDARAHIAYVKQKLPRREITRREMHDILHRLRTQPHESYVRIIHEFEFLAAHLPILPTRAEYGGFLYSFALVLVQLHAGEPIAVTMVALRLGMFYLVRAVALEDRDRRLPEWTGAIESLWGILWGSVLDVPEACRASLAKLWT